MTEGQPESPAPEQAPQFIGQYRIDSVLGRGGMGTVYRAFHSTLERPVALKLLPPEYAADPAFVSRFLREARVLAALRHDHIVQVHDAGHEDGRYYIAMELVAGQSLADLLDSGRKIPEKEALRMLRQTAQGLSAAHEKGLVHRDIKPENLLLDSQGEVRIADFGLALESAGVTRLTAVGATVGTPLYMSPEQADGAPADERSDLYNLGATFYHVFTGKPPFQASNVASLLYKHQREAPVDPRQKRPDLSAHTAQIVLRLLGKRPEDRPASARELLEWLDLVAQGKSLPPGPAPALLSQPLSSSELPVTMRQPTHPPHPRIRDTRWFRLLIGGGIALIVLVVIVTLSASQIRRTQEKTVRDALTLANAHLRDGKPEQAVALLANTSTSVPATTAGYSDLQALLERARREQRDAANRERLRDALSRAVRLCGENKPGEAVAILEEALRTLPADAPGRADVEIACAQARDEQSAQTLRQREDAFTRTLFSEEWKTCLEFVHPDDRMRLGTGGVEMRLGLLRGLAKLIKVSPETVRIDRVVLGSDRTTADVILSLKLNNEWKPQKPSVWYRKDDIWYLHVE